METRAASRFSPLMSNASEEELVEVKKGPWTEDEDALLMNYVSIYGEGHWNSVARLAGLKRTGKSCRLRWLNYLRPDLRRGNITLQEQLLILELHSHWGNRWSKIAQYLPGRTDNEIKNYWRTRVQKQAKQMKCDVNSKQFRDAMRFIWMPRLRERIQSSSANTSLVEPTNGAAYSIDHPISHTSCNPVAYQAVQNGSSAFNPGFSSEIPAASSQSYSDNIQGASLASDPSGSCTESITEGLCSWPQNLPDEGDLMMENLWNEENMLFLHQQLFDD